MRIVIVGGSRFGRAIAETLIEAKHEVVMIDRDHGRLETLAETLDCGMLHGDGTLPTTLRKAYRDEADVLVAVTNASEDNILACLVARSIGFGRVVPQIVSSELMKVCEELDLKEAMNPHASVAREVADAMEDREEMDNATALNKQLVLKRVHVPDRMDGTEMEQVDWPDDVRPIAVIRGEDEHLAAGDMALQSGDHILVVADRDRGEDLAGVFCE